MQSQIMLQILLSKYCLVWFPSPMLTTLRKNPFQILSANSFEICLHISNSMLLLLLIFSFDDDQWLCPAVDSEDVTLSPVFLPYAQEPFASPPTSVAVK